jgi:4-deoxy-L-threo-5-hexosulose-uronate ketol-isomerase
MYIKYQILVLTYAYKQFETRRKMETRHSASATDAKWYDTGRLRQEFLIVGLFAPGKIKRVYSHIDRIITMGFCPAGKALELGDGLDIMKGLGADYFLQQRELGVINIGGDGKITVDGSEYILKSLDGLYVGMGAKEVVFSSGDKSNPAKFYTLSAPAHTAYPNAHVDIEKAAKVDMGSAETCNKRVINQYIHPDVMQTCQLMMGLTEMAPGNVWNTMPCHMHERRMEVYFYFGMEGDNVVFHYMGEPGETRHLIVRNDEAVISPSWSIHSGCGTSAYKFIWGMAGENKTFTDMDHVDMKDLR